MSEVFSQAVDSVLTLFLIGLIGYGLARFGFINNQIKNFFPVMVVRVTLPCFLLSVTVKSYDRATLGAMVGWVGLGLITVLLTFSLALLAARLVKPERQRRGIFYAAFAASNTMYIGIPINLSLFGDAALAPAMAYFLANGLFFWTIGNYLMSLDGQVGRVPIVSFETVKRLIPPPMVGFIIGALLVLTGLKPPKFFLDATSAVGALNTPLAIMYIGLGFYGLTLSSLSPLKDIVVVLGGRFLICPAITLTFCLLAQTPTLTTQVFVTQSSLPVLAASAIMAGYYQSDPNYANVLVSLSTVLSLATIPIFRLIVTTF
ncbi:MAG: AEC family transporter [Deltaproteobacteria bacterium]|nr:AEC family transporter [Deltaproteobacteria bacterium]